MSIIVLFLHCPICFIFFVIALLISFESQALYNAVYKQSLPIETLT